MADVQLSNIIGTGSSRRYRLAPITASNASIAVPSWAQGGKGLVLVSGVGGGASGGVANTVSNRGSGGGAGAFAHDFPMLIPSGVTTLAAVIGAGGASVTPASATAADGNHGGDTTLTVGSMKLTLQGGRLGQGGGSTSLGGIPYVGSTPIFDGTWVSTVGGAPDTTNQRFEGYTSGASRLGVGARSGGGSSLVGGYGSGAYGPFGGGGAGVSSNAANQSGGAATGYGAGGAGANNNTAVHSSGAGAPGLLLLEFVEGF